jgi:hypothetical protein
MVDSGLAVELVYWVPHPNRETGGLADGRGGGLAGVVGAGVVEEGAMLPGVSSVRVALMG